MVFPYDNIHPISFQGLKSSCVRVRPRAISRRDYGIDHASPHFDRQRRNCSRETDPSSCLSSIKVRAHSTTTTCMQVTTTTRTSTSSHPIRRPLLRTLCRSLASFQYYSAALPPARPEKSPPCILLKQHPSSSRRGRREGKVRSHPPSPLLSPQVLSCEIMHSLGRTMSKGFYTTQACGMAWGIGGFKAGLAPLPVPFAKVEPRAG